MYKSLFKNFSNAFLVLFVGASIACTNNTNSLNAKVKVEARYEIESIKSIGAYGNPIGILVGPTGVGKTSLFSLVCDKGDLGQEGAFGVTQLLYRAPVAYGKKFDIVDTPGLDDIKDSLTPSFLLKTTLESTAYNTIFVVTPYNARFSKVAEQYCDFTEHFKKFAEKIVIMVSCFDKAKDKIKVKEGICDEFKLRKIDNQIIFFSSECSDPEDISLAMHASVSSIKPSTVILTEMEFNRGFNLVRLKDEKYEQMVDSYGEFNKSLKISFSCHMDAANRIKSQTEYTDEKLNYLLSHFRETANGLHESLAEKYGKVMEDFEDYSFYITLKSKVMNYIDKLSDFMESLDGSDMITRQLNKILRKCPHCGQIWSKVTGDGCDGNTKCGSKWEGAVDSDPIGFLKFQPKYDNNGNILDVFLLNKEGAKGISSKTGGTVVITQYGCGKVFEWRSAPILSAGELEKYRDVVSEESLNLITKEVNYKNYKEESLKKIDTSFHEVEKKES